MVSPVQIVYDSAKNPLPFIEAVFIFKFKQDLFFAGTEKDNIFNFFRYFLKRHIK